MCFHRLYLSRNQCGQFSRSDKQHFSHNGEILQAFTFDNRSCKKVVKYELITAAGSRHRVPRPSLGWHFCSWCVTYRLKGTQRKPFHPKFLIFPNLLDWSISHHSIWSISLAFIKKRQRSSGEWHSTDSQWWRQIYSNFQMPSDVFQVLLWVP